MSKNNSPYRVSQNFLTSPRTINRLLRLTSISEKDIVYEIGAGKGHITRQLIKSCGILTAYEIDPDLFTKLKIKFTDVDNLFLINKDFLSAALPPKKSYKIFSNIPFNITTKIMQKLIDCKNPPQEAWLVMEKGAAIRFCGARKDSLHSLMLKPLYEMKIVYYFKREDFHPAPSADVILLHMKKKAVSDIPTGLRKSYNDYIKNFYSKRGETLYVEWLCLFRNYLDSL